MHRRLQQPYLEEERKVLMLVILQLQGLTTTLLNLNLKEEQEEECLNLDSKVNCPILLKRSMSEIHRLDRHFFQKIRLIYKEQLTMERVCSLYHLMERLAF